MRFDVHPTAMKQKQGAPCRTHPAKSHRQERYVQQGVPQRELPVFLFLQDEPVPPAKASSRLRSNKSPSGAFERPNGLALARWRGLRPDK